MKVDIIPVRAQEVALLSQISGSTFYDAFAHLNHEPDVQHYIDTVYSERNLISELNCHNSSFYFAQADEEIAGYLKLNLHNAQTEFKESGGMEIQRIYVSKRFQGLRIGEQFINFAISKAVQQGCHYVWLGVWEHNTNAIRFYERMGFTVFSHHDFLLGDDLQTDLLMRMDI